MTFARDERFAHALVDCHEAIVRNVPPTSLPSGPIDTTDELTSRLRRGVRALELLERYRRNRDRSGAAESSFETPIVSDPGATDTLKHWRHDERPLKRLGHFRIIREIGRGGHGLVFLAEDELLQRQVALKVPLPECLLSIQMRQRFLREALAIARLTHPNLLAIFESGEDGPLCYLASSYCSGPTLAQWLKQQSSPVDERLAASIVAALADGVAYAHERGVLHRDIKPSNVFLDATPEGFVPLAESNDSAPSDIGAMCVPRLGDFGLARLGEETSDATRTGAQIGTPGYMSPEQAIGDHEQIGPTTDVYGLGTVLFELASGRRAFTGRNDADTLRQVVHEEAPPLRQLRHAISLDLSAICAKCLEKQPRDRYRSAAELSVDLSRFLRGEPTNARPLTRPERVRKWARRNPDWALASIVGILACLAFMALLTWSNIRTLRERDRAIAHEQLSESRRVTAEAAELRARKQQYAASIQMAAGAIEGGQRQSALHILKQLIPEPEQIDVRNFAWHYLWQQIHGYEHDFVGHTGRVASLAFAPDGAVLASGSWDGTVRLWSTADGALRTVLRGHRGHVNCMAFVSDGELLTGADDGTLKLWKLDGELLATIPAHQGDLLCLAVSKNGKLWATGGADRSVQLWDAEGRQRVTNTVDHVNWARGDWIRSLAFVADDTRLVVADTSRAIRIWNIETAAPEKTVSQENPAITVAVSPDSRTWASADGARIRFWDSSTGDARGETLSVPPGKIRSLAYSPDGRRIAVASESGNAFIFDLNSGLLDRTILAQPQDVMCVAYSPDGSRVACGGEDAHAQIWPVEGVAGGHTLCSVAHTAQDIAVDPTGRYLLAKHPKELTVLDLTANLQISTTYTSLHNFTSPPVFAPQGDEVAVGDSTGGISRINVPSGAIFPLMSGHSGAVSCVAYHPLAPILASTSGDHICIWNLQTGASTYWLTVPGEHPVGHLEFSPDGRLLIGSCAHDSTAYLWETKDYTPAGSLKPGGLELAVSKNGLLASRDRRGGVLLWDLESRQLVNTLAAQVSGDYGLTFSRDGRLLLTQQPDQIEFWDVETAQKLFATKCATSSKPVFSVNGTELYLLNAGNGEQLRIAVVSAVRAIPHGTDTQSASLAAPEPPSSQEAEASIESTMSDPLAGTVVVHWSDRNDQAASLGLLPDGRLLLVGRTIGEGSCDLKVGRYHADGAIDTTFGLAGVATTKIKDWSGQSCLVVLNDNSFLIGGTLELDKRCFFVMRFAPDGSRDETYGRNGVAVVDFPEPACLHGMAQDASGNVVAVGYTERGALSRFAMARLTADGKLDRRFGQDGLVTTGFEMQDYARSVAFVGTSIWVAGTSYDGHQDSLAFARYNPDGTLDESFSGDGRVTVQGGRQVVGARRFAILPDGGFVYGGLSRDDRHMRALMVRRLANGARDVSFPMPGSDGVIAPVIRAAQLVRHPVLIVQPDGKLLWLSPGSVGNNGDHELLIYRWKTDGTPDKTFGVNGTVTMRLAAGDDAIDDALLGPDGSIYLTGSLLNGDDNDAFLMRLTPNGQPFPGFGNGPPR